MNSQYISHRYFGIVLSHSMQRTLRTSADHNIDFDETWLGYVSPWFAKAKVETVRIDAFELGGERFAELEICGSYNAFPKFNEFYVRPDVVRAALKELLEGR